MRGVLRAFRWAVAMVLVGAASVVPACGTMGGGGMHYFIDSSPAMADAAPLLPAGIARDSA
jgi:hypothetical protein